jgi:hypothetical protein
MRFGVREIAEVTFRPLAAMDIGKQHFEKYQPCLFIDTATASNMEVATTTVYAQGGRGNARLIAWEGEKTATFTITDALLSPISFSMLSGAGVIDSNASQKVVHLTLEGEVKSGTTNDYVLVDKNDFLGYKIITKAGQAAGSSSPISINSTTIDYDDYKIYGMILDDQQVSVVDYLGEGEITNSELDSNGDLKISLQGKNATLTGHICRIDCYAVTESAQVTTLTVDAENFGGTFYIEAETLFRDEATGHDFPATFIIPKGKIQGNFTFSMAATGDPSTFDFTIDCTLGTIRGETKKVLYAIDIIDNISSDSHVESNADNVDYPTVTTVNGVSTTSWAHNSYGQTGETGE